MNNVWLVTPTNGSIAYHALVIEFPPIQRIVSGGQTGVDRAALDAAIWLGIPHGGWCPLGRRSEDGTIPDHYALLETEERAYSVRTERNVVDSDATLIFFATELSGGTALTVRMCKKHSRPYLLLDLSGPVDPGFVLRWLVQESVETLNVAGPRASTQPEVGEISRQLLIDVLRDVPAG